VAHFSSPFLSLSVPTPACPTLFSVSATVSLLPLRLSESCYCAFSTLPSPFPISTCFLSVSEPDVPSYQEGAHDSSSQHTETQNIRLVTRLHWHSHSPINLYIRTNLPILSPRICILVNEKYIHIFVLIHVLHICKLKSN